MSAALMAGLFTIMVGTAFLSGIFGMAGGLVLIGVLLALLPLPEAMALHAVTQMSSNGWRALLWYRHINFRAVLMYSCGAALAFLVWSFTRYVPSKPTALLLLGFTPFLARIVPPGMKPNPERLLHGIVYGAICMSLLLVTGVSGPLIDTYFLGGRMERRQIVATKSAVQIASHFAKLVYFGGLIDNAAGVDPVMAGLAVLASMIGTSAARPILDRLTDTQYRVWATRIITVIGVYYVAQGFYLLIA